MREGRSFCYFYLEFGIKFLSGLKLPNFKIERNGRTYLVQAWFCVDSCMRTEHPRFVRPLSKIIHTNRIEKVFIKTICEQVDRSAEHAFQHLLKINEFYYDRIIAEHLTAAAYMTNLTREFEKLTEVDEVNQAGEEEAAELGPASSVLKQIYGIKSKTEHF